MDWMAFSEKGQKGGIMDGFRTLKQFPFLCQKRGLGYYIKHLRWFSQMGNFFNLFSMHKSG